MRRQISKPHTGASSTISTPSQKELLFLLQRVTSLLGSYVLTPGRDQALMRSFARRGSRPPGCLHPCPPMSQPARHRPEMAPQPEVRPLNEAPSTMRTLILQLTHSPSGRDLLEQSQHGPTHRLAPIRHRFLPLLPASHNPATAHALLHQAFQIHRVRHWLAAPMMKTPLLRRTMWRMVKGTSRKIKKSHHLAPDHTMFLSVSLLRHVDQRLAQLRHSRCVCRQPPPVTGSHVLVRRWDRAPPHRMSRQTKCSRRLPGQCLRSLLVVICHRLVCRFMAHIGQHHHHLQFLHPQAQLGAPTQSQARALACKGL